MLLLSCCWKWDKLCNTNKSLTKAIKHYILRAFKRNALSVCHCEPKYLLNKCNIRQFSSWDMGSSRVLTHSSTFTHKGGVVLENITLVWNIFLAVIWLSQLNCSPIALWTKKHSDERVVDCLCYRDHFRVLAPVLFITGFLNIYKLYFSVSTHLQAQKQNAMHT